MLERELSVARDAVLRAGVEVARLRRDGVRYGRKDGWELVSEADLHASEVLHAALTGAFPSYGWLGEEHTDTAERLDCERVWVADPIDGIEYGPGKAKLFVNDDGCRQTFKDTSYSHYI